MSTRDALRLFILAFFLTVSQLHAEEQVVVLQVNESPPIWSQKLPKGGMGSEIVQAISQEMGMKTRIEFIPLKRLIADTHNNDVGNPLFYIQNQEFAQIIPIAVSYSALFAYKNDVESLLSNVNTQRLRIGVIKGTRVSSPTQVAHFEESDSHESLFRKLKAGRLDLVYALNLVGEEVAKKYADVDSKIVDKSSSAIAILIDINHPNAKAIALGFQKGLELIIKNGVYQSILDKYYKGSTPSNWYQDLAKFRAIYTIDLAGDE